MVYWLIFAAIAILLAVVRRRIREMRRARLSEMELAGTLGSIVVAIRPGHVGEVVFSKDGIRRSCAARSVSLEPVERGSEVVVLSVSAGHALVSCVSSPAGVLVDGGVRDSLLDTGKLEA